MLAARGSTPNDESKRPLLDLALAPCRALASAGSNAIPRRSRCPETNAQIGRGLALASCWPKWRGRFRDAPGIGRQTAPIPVSSWGPPAVPSVTQRRLTARVDTVEQHLLAEDPQVMGVSTPEAVPLMPVISCEPTAVPSVTQRPPLLLASKPRNRINAADCLRSVYSRIRIGRRSTGGIARLRSRVQLGEKFFCLL
jgi:hypothetical protein